MNTKKYTIICDNYHNGNISDAYNAIKSLNKISLIDFIYFWTGYSQKNIDDVLSNVHRALLYPKTNY